MVKIFVEGKGDKVFIAHLITVLFGENLTFDCEIISTNGWTNIPSLVNQFRSNTDFGGINLVIFDADDVLNGGGFVQRKSDILAQKENLKLDFQLFLFPNNQHDGTYEVLLEHIASNEHKSLMACFEAYEACVAAQNNADTPPLYQLPLRKAKIYAYISAFKHNEKERERIKKNDFIFENTAY